MFLKYFTNNEINLEIPKKQLFLSMIKEIAIFYRKIDFQYFFMTDLSEKILDHLERNIFKNTFITGLCVNFMI